MPADGRDGLFKRTFLGFTQALRHTAGRLTCDFYIAIILYVLLYSNRIRGTKRSLFSNVTEYFY